jgi:hypothetical protein
MDLGRWEWDLWWMPERILDAPPRQKHVPERRGDCTYKA